MSTITGTLTIDGVIIAGTYAPAGLKGDQGDTGPTGADGADSTVQGPAGTKGDTGADGLQGGTGPQGIQGDQGDTGPAGADGADGSGGISSGHLSFDALSNFTGNGTMSCTYRGVYFRTYFAYLITSPSLDVWVNYYDWETGLFGTPANWGNPRTGARDTHAQPSIAISASGHIIITQEKLQSTAADGHNSPIHIRRSTNSEDISTWSAVAGSPFSTNLSYPKFTRLPSGRLMLLHRSYRPNVVNWISDDEGVTWTNFDGTALAAENVFTTSFIVSYQDSSWAYSQGFQLDEGFALSLDRRLNSPSVYPQSFLIFTFDGVTWGNWVWYVNALKGVSAGFSKDCAASGAIIQTELNANCVGAGAANSNSTVLQYGMRDVKVSDDILAITFSHKNSSQNWQQTMKVFDKTGTVIAENDVYANTINQSSGTYNLGLSMIVVIDASRGVYDLLMKENAGQLVRYRTSNFGKTFIRRPDNLTTGTAASAGRGFGDWWPEYKVQTYIWEDSTGDGEFFAMRADKLD
jgi:hypothetical protein